MIIEGGDETIKTCLLTGGNGYLGTYILSYLKSLRWEVSTLGLRNINLYQCDLKTNIPNLGKGFDFVVHCAGKAHVFPTSKKEEQDFFEVNVLGMRNLLSALEKCDYLPRAIAFLSSVSVYGVDHGELISEDTPLQSKYAYGRSKIEAEKALIEWCDKNQVKYTILRVPLLAGKNPPGNLKNMIKSIHDGFYFNVSDSVQKSMVMADDVAKIIPVAISVGGIYNLTDGIHPSVKDLAGLMAKQLGKKRPHTIPVSIVKLLSFFAVLFSPFFPEQAYRLKKLMTTLTFDDSRARKMLGWRPDKVLDKFMVE